MREILFRGKSDEGDEWLYGDLTQVRLSILNKEDARYGMENTMMLSMCEACDTCLSGFSEQEVVAETVGQYTGLEDKNGVKIFEGDIVSGTAYSAEWRGVIVWIAEIASFGVRYIHRDGPTAWENSSILRALKSQKDEFSAEVIGNIYDNPELMKE